MNSDNHKKYHTLLHPHWGKHSNNSQKGTVKKPHSQNMYMDLFIVQWEDKLSSAFILQAQQASLEVHTQLIASYRLKTSWYTSREV